jgi:hypothetical protein
LLEVLSWLLRLSRLVEERGRERDVDGGEVGCDARIGEAGGMTTTGTARDGDEESSFRGEETVVTEVEV